MRVRPSAGRGWLRAHRRIPARPGGGHLYTECNPPRLMTASHAPILDAIAFQMVAALERYEQDCARLTESWLDMELYREVSEQVDQIRLYSASLPQLSVPWVELLIAHAELIHQMWRAQSARLAAGDHAFAQTLERHARAVRTLHQGCLRLLARPGQGGTGFAGGRTASAA